MESFLVQVWVPSDGTSGGPQLRGVVRHVASGTETAFRNDDEILLVLRDARGRGRSARQVQVQSPNEEG